MRKGKILLVIDLQDDFKVSPYYEKINKFIKEHKKDYKKVLYVYFYNQNSNKNFKRYLKWDNKGVSNTFLLSHFNTAKYLYKSGYGLDYMHLNHLDKEYTYDLVGCDIDACVMAIAFNLWDSNYHFRILTDYCYSSGGDEYKKSSVLIMKRNFGSAVVCKKEVEASSDLPQKET